ncbi:MAG: hypothetical protein A2293_16640 [Elusimicrobia bacterium RIFOXYB2_FULL_49_7]|nr:MAG: hypothetical protein A2293_16640 [Elusimicrobia bacterium RIFOXYB2_FULL_49_7]
MAKILLVDDDVDFLNATSVVLKAKGHEILTALDGTIGLNMAKQEHPDLVVLDVMMTSDSEGFEVARKLKEDEATKMLPVILLTGVRQAKGLPFKYEPDEDWLPVKAVLEKPVKPELLYETVEKALK